MVHHCHPGKLYMNHQSFLTVHISEYLKHLIFFSQIRCLKVSGVLYMVEHIIHLKI